LLGARNIVVGKPLKHRDKWRIRWLDQHGKRQSAVFDDYKRAQTELSRKQVEVEEIKRGIRNAAPPEKTVNDLCDYWTEKRAPRKRSKKDDLSIIRKHLRPFFGAMKVRDVGTEEGDDYVNLKIDDEGLGDKTVNNHLTLLTTMLNMAANFKVPWIVKVPKFHKPKVTLFSTDYQWLRNDDEVRRFLAAARDEDEHVFVFYALALYAGLRAGEIAALEWPDVDLDRRLIIVQRSFDGPTKSDRVRYVPILDPLLPVLRAWRLRHPGRLVFTNLAGTMFQPSARIFQEVLHRVLDAAGFPKVERNGRERPYVRFHDLRHSYASHWVMKGGDLFKLQKILGHQSVQMTMRYAHLAPEAFKDDYARLGSAITFADAAVIEMKQGARASGKAEGDRGTATNREVAAGD
jgi:integrase